jgi:hypothetical protein
LIPAVGGTPFPFEKLPASAEALVATGSPAAVVVAKLKPQRLSSTLTRPRAFEYVIAIDGVASA